MTASQRSVIDMLRAHWRLYVLEGVLMIVLGLLAIASPVFATLAVDLYLGWLFLFSGLFAVIAAFSARQFPGFWWALVTALVSVLVGVAAGNRRIRWASNGGPGRSQFRKHSQSAIRSYNRSSHVLA